MDLRPKMFFSWHTLEEQKQTSFRTELVWFHATRQRVCWHCNCWVHIPNDILEYIYLWTCCLEWCYLIVFGLSCQLQNLAHLMWGWYQYTGEQESEVIRKAGVHSSAAIALAVRGGEALSECHHPAARWGQRSLWTRCSRPIPKHYAGSWSYIAGKAEAKVGQRPNHSQLIVDNWE